MADMAFSPRDRHLVSGQILMFNLFDYSSELSTRSMVVFSYKLNISFSVPFLNRLEMFKQVGHAFIPWPFSKQNSKRTLFLLIYNWFRKKIFRSSTLIYKKRISSNRKILPRGPKPLLTTRRHCTNNTQHSLPSSI